MNKADERVILSGGINMILLLGKNDVVEEYAKDVLKIDMGNDIVYYPSVTTHHTELLKYVDIAREEEPPVITTQRTDMLDTLLESDLEFDVVRVSKNKHGLWGSTITKAEAKEMRDEYDMELR